MRILVIDDNRLLVEGLRYILPKLNHQLSIQQQTDLSGALSTLEHEDDIGLVLIGVQLWATDPKRFTRLVNDYPIPVILLNADDKTPYIDSLPSSALAGFIHKSYTEQQLLQALESVLKGHKHIPLSMIEGLEKKTGIRSTRPFGAGSCRPMGVTKRQHEVLRLMAQGYSNKMIADTLCLTEHTIKSHVSALFQAMNSRNRTECVLEASQKGLIQAEMVYG